MRELAKTVTFITGASSGIGAAIAREVARRGGNVVLAARRQKRLQAVAAEIEDFGQRALAVKCDVTQDGELEQAVTAAIEQFGRIDYVVASAGFGIAGRFEKLALEDHRRQFETNVFGVIRTVLAVRDHLIASRGYLVLIGSVNGYIATPRSSSYVMSKFAIHGLADALRHELRPHGVGVGLVVPGFVDTEARQINKYGVYLPDAKDRIPRWLRMPADKAARQITRAMVRRKRLKILTWYGVILIFVQRHFPCLIHLFLSRSVAGKQRKQKQDG